MTKIDKMHHSVKEGVKDYHDSTEFVKVDVMVEG